jgi:hypothetical protein
MAIGLRFYAGGPASAGPGAVIASSLPAVLYEVSAVNVSGADRWLQVHNKGVPGAGDIPTYSYFVRDGETIAIAPPGPPQDIGRPFDVAIGVIWSTTQAVCTPAGAASGPIYVAGRQTA